MSNGVFGTLFTLGVGAGIGYFIGSDRWKKKYDDLLNASQLYVSLTNVIIEDYTRLLKKMKAEKESA